MATHTKNTYITVGIAVLVIIGWIILFHFFPPNVLVEKIGIKNSYLIAFVMSVIGGFSSITGTSVYAALAAIAHSGGVNVTMLGIVSGLGIFLSDSLFYFAADYGRGMIVRIASEWETVFNRVRRWVRIAPDWLVYLGIVAYSAFSPFPNDILLAVLVVSGYSYRQFAPYLFVGDLTAMILLTHVAGAIAQ